MKKTIAILLVLCLCIGLCACGKEASTRKGYPKDWDRIAEATATLNRYYACETEDEFRAVLSSSISDSNLKMIMDNMLSFRQAGVGIDNEVLAEQYVRKIKFIETYKGCDVFAVSLGYVTTGGYQTPDDPIPEMKAPMLGSMSISSMNFMFCALAFENGQYVLANSFGNNWANYYESIVPCTCDLGVVVVPGDPCKGCNGTGCLSEQSSADTENEDNGTCATCNGTGWVDIENHTEDASGSDQSSIVLNQVQCPDCSVVHMDSFVGSPNLMLQLPCSDCEGTGLENYSLGDCPDCSGKGYNKIS